MLVDYELARECRNESTLWSAANGMGGRLQVSQPAVDLEGEKSGQGTVNGVVHRKSKLRFRMIRDADDSSFFLHWSRGS